MRPDKPTPMIIPLLKYRHLIWRHALADVRHRYAGTNLGVVWNVLHPVAMIAVYSLVFTAILRPARSAGEGPLDYVLYLCSGFLPWLAFVECVTRGTSAFSDNAVYLKKLPIPEQVFVAQAAASATMGLTISFALLVVLSLLLHPHPTIYWLLLPLPLIAMQGLGFGLGLLLGTINVFLRDVGQLLVVALQIAMWTVPVVYRAADLPHWASAAMRWHPVYPALDGVRSLFLYGRMPDGWGWALMFAWPAAIITGAALVFHRLRPEIRDVL